MKRKKTSKRDEPICRLREIRKERGLSIPGLSEESGVPQNRIIYIETGRGEGLPSTHLKLAKALKVSLDEYFSAALPEGAERPEMIVSDPNFTVEQIFRLSGLELEVKRIQLVGRKECDLSPHLNLKKPAFLYLSQGDAKIRTGQKENEIKAGGYIWLSDPRKTRIENGSGLALILLVVQP